MGGTFDPIHNGHLEAAQQVSQLFKGADVHLLPAKIPVHKAKPSTQAEQRVAMLQLAIESHSALKLDLREIEAITPSYTIDTLRQLRTELGAKTSIVMVIGMDSYLTLGQWKNSEEILQYCHLVVLQRPQYRVNLGEGVVYRAPLAKRVESLLESACGTIYFFEQEPIDISASEIRQQIVNSETPHLLPPKVEQYITKHHLYRAGARP